MEYDILQLRERNLQQEELWAFERLILLHRKKGITLILEDKSSNRLHATILE